MAAPVDEVGLERRPVSKNGRHSRHATIARLAGSLSAFKMGGLMPFGSNFRTAAASPSPRSPRLDSTHLLISMTMPLTLRARDSGALDIYCLVGSPMSGP